MKRAISILSLAILVISMASCKKEDLNNSEDEELHGYITYYGLIVPSNPSNFYKDTIQHSATSYWAELKIVGGVQQLKIYWGDQYNNVTVTVDYEGVGNYSSDDTNLQCRSYSYNGYSNPTMVISPDKFWTGGYMEILTHEDDIITGNLRYINYYYDSNDATDKYGGIDDCLFEIKLNP